MKGKGKMINKTKINKPFGQTQGEKQDGFPPLQARGLLRVRVEALELEVNKLYLGTKISASGSDTSPHGLK